MIRPKIVKKMAATRMIRRTGKKLENKLMSRANWEINNIIMACTKTIIRTVEKEPSMNSFGLTGAMKFLKSALLVFSKITSVLAIMIEANIIIRTTRKGKVI